MFTPEIKSLIENSSSRALATCGSLGVNVVPVSVLTVQNDVLYLYNFFMGKTIKNILDNSAVSLVVWSGLNGLQIKGQVQYVTEGQVYDEAKIEMLLSFPKRLLCGVLILTPSEICDVGISNRVDL